MYYKAHHDKIPQAIPPMMILYAYQNISLEISLSESEKEEVIEFEMDCIANMLRNKSTDGVAE